MLYLLTGLERKRCLAKTAPGHSPPCLLCESSRRGDRGGGEGRGRSVASSLIVLAHFGHVANYAIVGLVHGILVLQRLQVRQAATSRPRMSQITLVLDLKCSKGSLDKAQNVNRLISKFYPLPPMTKHLYFVHQNRPMAK